MAKIKKIQKEVQFLKTLIEEYKGGRNDERYSGFIDKLNNHKKELKGWSMLLSKNLKESVLQDIEYCLNTLENRVEKVSDSNLTINKVKYDLQQLKPHIKGFNGKRNDLEYVQYKNKLHTFSKSLQELSTIHKSTQEVRDLYEEIEQCSDSLEDNVKNKEANRRREVKSMSFEATDGQAASKMKNRPKSTAIDFAKNDDWKIKMELDELDIIISKIKLNIAITNREDVDRLEQLCHQILDTYTSLELLPKAVDGKIEERKQNIGRTLVSLNKKLSMDIKESSKLKQEYLNKLNEIHADIKALEKDINSCKTTEINYDDIEQIDEEINRLYENLDKIPLESLKKDYYAILEKLSNQMQAYLVKLPFDRPSHLDGEEEKIIEEELQNYIQMTLQFKEDWIALRDKVFKEKIECSSMSDIIEVLVAVRNDIRSNIKSYQAGLRPQVAKNVKPSLKSFDEDQFADEVFTFLEAPKSKEHHEIIAEQVYLNDIATAASSTENLDSEPVYQTQQSRSKNQKVFKSVEELRKNFDGTNSSDQRNFERRNKNSLDFARSQLDHNNISDKPSKKNNVSFNYESSTPPALPKLPPPIRKKFIEDETTECTIIQTLSKESSNSLDNNNDEKVNTGSFKQDYTKKSPNQIFKGTTNREYSIIYQEETPKTKSSKQVYKPHDEQTGEKNDPKNLMPKIRGSMYKYFSTPENDEESYMEKSDILKAASGVYQFSQFLQTPEEIKTDDCLYLESPENVKSNIFIQQDGSNQIQEDCMGFDKSTEVQKGVLRLDSEEDINLENKSAVRFEDQRRRTSYKRRPSYRYSVDDTDNSFLDEERYESGFISSEGTAV